MYLVDYFSGIIPRVKNNFPYDSCRIIPNFDLHRELPRWGELPWPRCSQAAQHMALNLRAMDDLALSREGFKAPTTTQMTHHILEDLTDLTHEMVPGNHHPKKRLIVGF